jgi:ClpP class serine protease
MKRILDPFTSKTEEDYEKLGKFSKDIFIGFKEHVEAHRKISEDPVERDKVFNANVFLADEAKQAGYILFIKD